MRNILLPDQWLIATDHQIHTVDKVAVSPIVTTEKSHAKLWAHLKAGHTSCQTLAEDEIVSP